jgi:hypothetical protein
MTRKYTIKIVIKHAHAWNWDGKGSRNFLLQTYPTRPNAKASLQRYGKVCEDI